MVCFCFFLTALGCRESSSTPAVCWRHLRDWCGVAHRCFEGRRTHAQSTFECHLTLAIPPPSRPAISGFTGGISVVLTLAFPWSIDSDWQILLYPVPCAGAGGACCSGLIELVVEPVSREGFRVPEAQWGRRTLSYSTSSSESPSMWKAIALILCNPHAVFIVWTNLSIWYAV